MGLVREKLRKASQLPFTIKILLKHTLIFQRSQRKVKKKYMFKLIKLKKIFKKN
jgi:hypothetical protein